MNHLFSAAAAGVLERYCSERVLLAFDFDGTLAPIVTRPDAARMREVTRERLQRVCERYPCVVVSGRAYGDVQARVAGVGVAAVVGNHGIEPTAGMERFADVVRAWLPALVRGLAALPGVELEDKTYSVAIHHRRARDKRAARAAIERVTSRLVPAPRVVRGKQVINLVPEGAPHKGAAVQRLRRELGLDAAVYVGDDLTDEDAFAASELGRLLAVRIGRARSSHAPYYLRDQREIDLLLERLCVARR